MHDYAQEVGADGGGTLVRGGSEAGVAAPTCMRCGACPGKVGSGGAIHTSLHWPHAFRKVRRLRCFLPHVGRARQACGRAVGADIRRDAASRHPDASLSLFLTMTRVC